MLSTFTLHRGTCFVAHSRRDAQWLSTKFPEAKVQFYPHPLYDHFPPSDNALPRRSKLELLFFGLVRPYKGLDVLASTMEELKGLDVFLTVAGEWWTKDLSLRDRLLATGQVEILDSYAPPSTVARLFTRADVVVLPYREATGSGVLSIAYHYAKPVIATRTGGFPDVVTDGVSGRLVPPGDPKALASAVREFLKAPPPGTPEGVRETAVQMTWAGLADCVVDIR